MSFVKKSFACFALVAAIALPPQAAVAETLYQAMAKAYENNPDLNAARAGLRATDEGVALAKSGYRPYIGAEATTTSTSTNGRVSNSASVGVTITQTLFDGFQTRNNVRAAEAQVFAGRENLRGTEIDILLATVQAYANVNRDNQIVVYRKQNIAFLQEQYSAARARFDVGESTRTDVSQAEAQLAGAMRQRCHGDDPTRLADGRCRRGQPLEEQVGQQLVADVVHAEGRLEPLSGHGSP